MLGCLRVAAVSSVLSLALLPEARESVVAAGAALPSEVRIVLVILGPLVSAWLLCPALAQAIERPILSMGCFSSAGAVLALAVGCWFVPADGYLEGIARWVGVYFTIVVVFNVGKAVINSAWRHARNG